MVDYRLEGILAETEKYNEQPMVFDYKHCSTYRIETNVLNGNIDVAIWRCKDHRNCENCNRVYIMQMQRVLEIFESQQEGDLVSRIIDKKEYAKLQRKVGSDYLARYPQKDGSILIVFHNSLSIHEEDRDTLFDVAAVTEDKYMQHLLTPPEGKRASGAKLAREQEKQERQDKRLAETKTVTERNFALLESESEPVCGVEIDATRKTLASTENGGGSTHRTTHAIDDEEDEDGGYQHKGGGTKAASNNETADEEDLPDVNDFAAAPGATIEVAVPMLFARGSHAEVIEAAKKAMADTLDEQRVAFDGDVYEAERRLKSKLENRMMQVRYHLWNAGIEFYVQYKKVEVNLTEVRW